jgi:hypothetical protein
MAKGLGFIGGAFKKSVNEYRKRRGRPDYGDEIPAPRKGWSPPKKSGVAGAGEAVRAGVGEFAKRKKGK